MKIFPSLISSDLLNLEKSIKILEPESDGFHIDVMDDHFVPNLTWGPAFINSIVKKTKKKLDIHLMVDDAYLWLDRLNLRPFDFFTFHYEAVDKDLIKSFIFKIKSRNLHVGMAIKPKTKVEKIINYLSDLDTILLMSVEPGFSGQKYISGVEDKIQPLLDYKKQNNCTFKIGMDGGIGKQNISKLKNLGVDLFHIGSAIFSQSNWSKTIKELKNNF